MAAFSKFSRIFRAPFAAVALAAGVLAACSGGPEPKPVVCPSISTLPDATRKVAFAETGRDLTDVLYEVRIVDGLIDCERDENVIESEFKIQFLATRGPANKNREARFQYVVAMLDPEGVVISREEFGLIVPFQGTQSRVVVTDTLSPTIPLNAGESPRQYRLYVGLKLSEAELEYNRKNRR
ncbi:MAG: hypothetical protein R3316_06800 [Rhodovibrionaceae bacterium]|nr:hypothetical protein [Rhodovibrionaceae bacterium]